MKEKKMKTQTLSETAAGLCVLEKAVEVNGEQIRSPYVEHWSLEYMPSMEVLPAYLLDAPQGSMFVLL